jgi:hypothetical protein
MYLDTYMVEAFFLTSEASILLAYASDASRQAFLLLAPYLQSDTLA